MNFVMKHFRLKKFFSFFSFAVFGIAFLWTAGTPCSLSAQPHTVRFPAAADLPDDPYASASQNRTSVGTSAIPAPDETASPAGTAISSRNTVSPESAASPRTAASSGSAAQTNSAAQSQQAAQSSPAAPSVPDSRFVSPFRDGLRTVSDEPNGSQRSTIVPAQSPQNMDLNTMDLLLGPMTSIALPGSQVILTAGVRDQSGYLRTNQRIDWRISPESVGHFSRIQERDLSNILVFDFVKPKIISDTQAVTTTLRSSTILDRGTPELNDDIQVRRGESWVSVSSPREGVTRISAHAPYLQNTTGQTREAQIFWIDAAVRLPESKVLDFGSRYTLKTSLRRNSDRQPLSRWRVRYEICGNSSAVLGNGNKMLEVYTDENGEARIEMHQTVSQEEETRVSVQIIHPEDENFPSPVLVQESKLNFRWKPDLVKIEKTLPENAFIGSAVSGYISVTNLTDRPIQNLRISDFAQPGLTLKKAEPQGHDSLEGRQWLIDTLEPFSTQTIALTYLVEQPGTHISYTQLQVQQMGSEQTIETSAAVRAGSDTSPYTPPLQNNAPAIPQGDSSAPKPEALPAPDDNMPHTGTPGSSDPSGTSQDRLPPPTVSDDGVYVPENSTDPSAPAETSGRSEAGKGSDPTQQPSEIAAQSPKNAPVSPRPNPSDLIQLDLTAPAEVHVGESFPLDISVINRTMMAQKNIQIYLNTSEGIHTRSTENVYSVQRKFDLGPNTEQHINTELRPVRPGTQNVIVKIKLPNGKEYQRQALIQVLENTDSDGTFSNSAETPNSADTQIVPADTQSDPDGLQPDPADTQSNVSENTSDAQLDNTLPGMPELSEPPLPDRTKMQESPELPVPNEDAADGASADDANSAGDELPRSLELPDPLDTPEIPKQKPAKTPQQNTGTPGRHSADPAPSASPTIRETLEEENDGNSQFSLALTGSSSLIRTGDTFSYTLKVTNTTNSIIQNTEIMLAFPSENLEIMKDSLSGLADADIDTTIGTVKYAPIPQLQPGETIECQVAVKALKSGTFQAHAELFLDGKPAADKTLETTIRETASTKRN